MIDDIYKRTKVLSKACLKIALVLPGDKALSVLIRSHLVEASSKMTIKAKGLMATQVQDYFLRNIIDAKECADSCHYWLEIVKEEHLLDSHIIDPILAESNNISGLFALAMKKVKPNNY